MTTLFEMFKIQAPEFFREGVSLDVEHTQAGNEFRGHLDGHFRRILGYNREDRVPLGLCRGHDAGGGPLGVGGERALPFPDPGEEADGGVGGGAALDRHPRDLPDDGEAVLAVDEKVGQSRVVHGHFSHEQNAGVVQRPEVLRAEGPLGLQLRPNILFCGIRICGNRETYGENRENGNFVMDLLPSCSCSWSCWWS